MVMGVKPDIELLLVFPFFQIVGDRAEPTLRERERERAPSKQRTGSTNIWAEHPNSKTLAR